MKGTPIMNDPSHITPQSTIMDVLDAYPELEATLMDAVPLLKKITHPELRRTVGRTATLQQAAATAGADVGELVHRMRRAAGPAPCTGEPGAEYRTARPEWFDENRIVATLDAGRLLAEGKQPVHQVMADLQNLSVGKVYKLQAPFLPAPLIDKATSLGLDHWVHEDAEGAHTVYFYKENDHNARK